MKSVADNIKSNNLIAGLWWMLAQQCTGANNASGCEIDDSYCQKPTEFSSWAETSMDPSHSGVRSYLKEVANRIANTWGYKYHKIDGMFTWMGAHQNYVNDGYKSDDMYFSAQFSNVYKTNMEVWHDAWGDVRSSVGQETFIMGCTPAQNMRTMCGSFGVMDALRIGPDNSVGSWDPTGGGGILRGVHRGSQRYFFNGRVWWVDPDPVYVRSPDLTAAQARCNASICAVAGWMYTLSENFPTLPADRVNIIKRTIPPHGLTTARPVDYYDRSDCHTWQLVDTDPVRRDVIGFFNWATSGALVATETMARLGLSTTAQYVGYEFWTNTFIAPFSGTLSAGAVAATDCKVIALRQVMSYPIVLSTSRHVTQGVADITAESWNAGSKTLSGTSKVVGGDAYELRIYAPSGMTAASAATSTSGATIGTPSAPVNGLIKATINCSTNKDVAWSVTFN
jgi:hypothetical protein